MNRATPTELKKYQRRMRRWPSRAEATFADRLEAQGIEFKTQVILGFYIADFILPAHMMCIEIDGPEHKSRRAYDKMRTAFIEAAGFKVIRITNEEAASFPLDFLTDAPTYPPARFTRGCSRAMSQKGLVQLGCSKLPTLGQSSLF